MPPLACRDSLWFTSGYGVVLAVEVGVDSGRASRVTDPRIAVVSNELSFHARVVGFSTYGRYVKLNGASLDAATAAIIASAITGGIALAVAIVNPLYSAKRAHDAKLIDLRYKVYSEALEAVSRLHNPGEDAKNMAILELAGPEGGRM